MASIGKFKTDKKREQEGVWVDAGEGLKLKLARLGNPKYEALMQQLGKPYRRQIRNNTIDVDVLRGLTARALARHVLLDWSDLQDEETGEDITYSQEKALELLKNYRDFYDMVVELANDQQFFRDDYQAESMGNSENASNGISNGENT